MKELWDDIRERWALGGWVDKLVCVWVKVRRGVDGAGGVISLYPVWRAADGLYPHQLSTLLQLPVAVQSKAGLSAGGLPGRMHVAFHPLLHFIYGSPCPVWKPSPEHPGMGLGCSYKKIKASKAWVWWSLTKAGARVCRGRLLYGCLWGLARISWWLAVIDSIWDAFSSTSRLRPVHMLASSKGP